MTRLRIALVSAYDTSASGGLSTFVKLYAQGLREAGHDVVVIDERSIPAWKRALAFWLVRNPLYVVKKDWGMRAYFSLVTRMLRARLAREARKAGKRIDALHAQDVLAANAAGGIAGLKGAPLLLTVHGDLTNMCLSDGVVTPGGPGERRARREETAGYDIADTIVAVDTRLRTHVEAISRREDVVSIKNFVDVRAFAPADGKRREALRREKGVAQDAFVVFCPRRLVKKNGVVHAARAAAKAGKKDRRIMLVVAGDGPERAAIDAALKDAGAGKASTHVRLLGDVPHAEIAAWYALCDAVVIPSVTSEGVIEATSISALEGMACGKPVIASAIGGLAELIEDKRTGILTPEGDEEALAQAMLALARDPRKGARLGAAARKFVQQRHSVASQTRLYLAQLERARKRRLTRVLFVNTFPGAHYAYLELMRAPPPGMRFLNANEYSRGHVSATLRSRGPLDALKRLAERIPIPTLVRVPKTRCARADLVYVSQAIPLTCAKWAMDSEMPVALSRFHQRTFDNAIFRALVRRSLRSPRCVAITTWTQKAKDGFVSTGLADERKVHVARPALSALPALPRRAARKGKRLLFVAADFERKGGVELLLAFPRIRAQVPDATLLVVSEIPQRHTALARQPGVRVIARAPREELYGTHYPWADVLVHPTHQDTYGFVLLEAMAFGIPVVVSDIYAMRELVEDSRTGIVIAETPPSCFSRDGTFVRGYTDIYAHVDRLSREMPDERERFIEGIARACAMLLKDDALRRRMGIAARARVERGSLSLSRHREDFLRAMRGGR